MGQQCFRRDRSFRVFAKSEVTGAAILSVSSPDDKVALLWREGVVELYLVELVPEKANLTGHPMERNRDCVNRVVGFAREGIGLPADTIPRKRPGGEAGAH